jgi:hypothetical protein
MQDIILQIIKSTSTDHIPLTDWVISSIVPSNQSEYGFWLVKTMSKPAQYSKLVKENFSTYIISSNSFGEPLSTVPTFRRGYETKEEAEKGHYQKIKELSLSAFA